MAEVASPSHQFDLVLLGGGTGGYVAAIRAKQLGLNVAVVEELKLGGTCLHRGCIPTKAMLHAADVVSEIKEAARMGVMVEGVKVEWDKVLGHKRQVVSSNAGGVAHLMKSRKVDVVTGFGRVDFSGGKRRVIVKGDEIHEIPAAPVAEVVDTTGAGDQFAAGFLYGLTREMPLGVCGRLGVMAAAEVISHYGARPEVSLEKLAQKNGLL